SSLMGPYISPFPPSSAAPGSPLAVSPTPPSCMLGAAVASPDVSSGSAGIALQGWLLVCGVLPVAASAAPSGVWDGVCARAPGCTTEVGWPPPVGVGDAPELGAGASVGVGSGPGPVVVELLGEV